MRYLQRGSHSVPDRFVAELQTLGFTWLPAQRERQPPAVGRLVRVIQATTTVLPPNANATMRREHDQSPRPGEGAAHPPAQTDQHSLVHVRLQDEIFHIPASEIAIGRPVDARPRRHPLPPRLMPFPALPLTAEQSGGALFWEDAADAAPLSAWWPNGRR